MIKDILKDIRELRDEMVQQNWPAQRLSNIILKYEMKLQEDKHKYTTEELVEATNTILKTPSEKLQDELEPISDVYDERY